MTCRDYDLCKTCEVQGIHSSHNMMRISTPEPIWPGIDINSLKNMQNRASKCNEESRKQGGACRFPRGTWCPARGTASPIKGTGYPPRDTRCPPKGTGCPSRGTGCPPRGFGGMKRGGCKVLPPPFCWMTNQQYCNNSKDSANSTEKNSEESSSKYCKPDEANGARSPMNDLLNIGEIVRATEESVRTALESAHLNSKDSHDSDSKEQSKDSNEHPTNDLNNLGEVIKALLGSFGVNVDVSTKTESDESDKKSPQEEPMDSKNSSKPKASENNENSEDSNQTEEHQKTDSAEKPAETGGAIPKTRSIPVLTENDGENKSPYSALEKEVQEALEETVMPLSPKIKIALQAMENMGFNNDNDWLSNLLMKYDGDIGKVLDLINKRN